MIVHQNSTSVILLKVSCNVEAYTMPISFSCSVASSPSIYASLSMHLSSVYNLLASWIYYLGFPGGSDGKEFTCNAKDLDLNPGLERCPGAGHGNPLHCPCLENPHGQRSLAGCSPWGCKELDMTKQLSTA